MADRGLQIKYLPLDKLVPYAGNARRHPEAQIAKLCDSLAKFGWTNPILHADRQLIAGHGRLQAAIRMRDTGRAIAHNANAGTAPTVDLSHLSVDERRAYVLADNRIAEDGDWDPEMLRSELAELMRAPIDLGLTGFDLEQLRDAVFPKEDESTKATGVRRLGGGLKFQVVIDCMDETHQAELIAEFREREFQCRPWIL